MHKVLKDYLMTSRGDLLRVVQIIKEMIHNQYNKYRKDIATAQHTIGFDHKLEAMPFLPPGIHRIVTPPAIEHVRQQELLRQKHWQECRIEPCTGSFERTYGLPCSHKLQMLINIRSILHLDHFQDDHWRYKRRQGQSISMSPRPHQHILEPLPVPGRGRPRRDEASTRRDPSAFEQPVPPSSHQSPPRTLAEVLQETITTLPSTSQPGSVSISVSAPISVSVSAVVPAPISVSVPISVPITVPISPTASSPPSTSSSPKSSISINVSVPVSINVTPRQSPHQSPQQLPQRSNPPTLEEFLIDIERRRSQPIMQEWNDPNSLFGYLAESGQENDLPELVAARNMALTTTGVFASCTPTMAWNWFFGNKEAFYAERFAQVRDQNLNQSVKESSQRPKRAAAEKASAVWDELQPRKRQRKQ
jgi:hypothetical protein